MDVVVMDFSHIYSKEVFSGCDSLTWIDCTSILGTNCYCDDEAQAEIKRLIAPYHAEGVHFIDSGNFHYVSKFWNEKVKEPYSLVVFDHHPDMQAPKFEKVLSCGSWVRTLLETHSWLKEVYIVGASETLKQESEGYGDRLHYISESDLADSTDLCPFRFADNEKTYISIDLDVLATCEIRTNWDQGSMSLELLKYLLNEIFSLTEVIGVDICGGDSNISVLEKQHNLELNKKLYSFIISGLRDKDIWQR